MLSPLKPLLCRHDFYWSERHRADRCRRCGKRQAAEAIDVLSGEPPALTAPRKFADLATPPLALEALPAYAPAGGGFIDFEAPRARLAGRSPRAMAPGAGLLKAQARERREKLLNLLDLLAEGTGPSWEEAIDAVLGVIEDAHSADPVLFGADAAGHFARLHDARTTP